MALTSTAIQLIDETCQFNGAVGKYMSKLHLQGFDYHLIAVFGSQSTGKSTLLNGLFGTSFDVMDETVRKQTTKGKSRICFASIMYRYLVSESSEIEHSRSRRRGHRWKRTSR